MQNYELQEVNQEWWVIGGGSKFGPFTKVRAEEVVAMLNAQGIVNKGGHSGSIIAIEGGLVIQRTGRYSEFVLHDASKLRDTLKKDVVVDINYTNGIGIVKGVCIVER